MPLINEFGYGIGPVAALLLEYERAVAILQRTVGQLSDDSFNEEFLSSSFDEGFRSAKAIVTHVIEAGLIYAENISSVFGFKQELRSVASINTVEEALETLNFLLSNTKASLTPAWSMSGQDLECCKINSTWNGIYDLEQLLEHSIVHILRHEMQIKRLISIRSKTSLPFQH